METKNSKNQVGSALPTDKMELPKVSTKPVNITASDAKEKQQRSVVNNPFWRPSNYDDLPSEWRELFDNNPWVKQLENFERNPYKPRTSDKEYQQLIGKVYEYMNEVYSKWISHINSLPETDVAHKLAAGYNMSFESASGAPSPASSDDISVSDSPVSPSDSAELSDIFSSVFNNASKIFSFGSSLFGMSMDFSKTMSELSQSEIVNDNLRIQRDGYELENIIKAGRITDVLAEAAGSSYTEAFQKTMEDKLPESYRRYSALARRSALAEGIKGEADIAANTSEKLKNESILSEEAPVSFGGRSFSDGRFEANRDTSLYKSYARWLKTEMELSHSLQQLKLGNEIDLAPLYKSLAIDDINTSLSRNSASRKASVYSKLNFDKEIEFLKDFDASKKAAALNHMNEIDSLRAINNEQFTTEYWSKTIELLNSDNWWSQQRGLYRLSKIMSNNSTVQDVGSGAADAAKLAATLLVK